MKPAPFRASGQLRLDLSREPSHARSDFVVSDCNRIACDLVWSWPRWPGHRLAIAGAKGSGKTHLGRAWAETSGAIDLPTYLRLPQGARLAALLIDDADELSDDALLFEVLNLADAGVPVLLTGSSPPSCWSVKLPDLESRLRALTVASLDPPDDTLLVAVMRKLFRERNIAPGSGVEAYLLRRCERSPAAVGDLVLRIDEYASANRLEITLALARQVLQTGDGDKPGPD